MSGKRVLWEVTPHAFAFGLLGWKITRKDGLLKRGYGVFPDKEDAVAFATSQCKFYWKALHEKSELKIKNKWGRIQDSRTYGEDPESIHG